MGRHHQLKTWPEPFQAVLDGIKRFEVRIDDRGFAVGDTLHLVEWNPTSLGLGLGVKGSTGRQVFVTVTYMVPGGHWGLPQSMCVMSISILDGADVPGQEGR
jgi:hypothetical protein